MPATGLNKDRLKEKLFAGLQPIVEAAAGEVEDGKGPFDALEEMCDVIAKELIAEIKQAKVEVKIPIGQVLTAAQAGVPNAAPITANNDLSGGIT